MGIYGARPLTSSRMNSVKKLIQYFEKFPGIGPRQARRFVYHLLTQSSAALREMSESLNAIKREMGTCERCFRFFETTDAQNKVCALCSNNGRSAETLMVVSKDIDLENIERSGAFRGHYFVLGGTIPILEKNPEKKVRFAELLKRITRGLREGLSEVIFALNSTPEGDHTAEYLFNTLKPLGQKHNIKISTLGRGLSTGLELEYSDGDTIKHAIKNRA